MKIKVSEAKVDELIAENDSLREELQKLKDSNKSLSFAVEIKSKRLNMLEKERNELSYKNLQHIKELDELDLEIQSLLKDFQAQTDDLDKLKTHNKELMIRIFELEAYQQYWVNGIKNTCRTCEAVNCEFRNNKENINDFCLANKK